MYDAVCLLVYGFSFFHSTRDLLGLALPYPPRILTHTMSCHLTLCGEEVLNVKNLPPFHLGLVRDEMPLIRQIRDAKPGTLVQLREERTLV